VETAAASCGLVHATSESATSLEVDFIGGGDDHDSVIEHAVGEAAFMQAPAAARNVVCLVPPAHDAVYFRSPT
jgi:hypothetical protein